jgi:hypothetical protein
MIDTNETRDHAPERRAEPHHVHYDPASDVTASELLVAAVADIADADPIELEPLYETVDPETIDDFVRSGGSADVDGHISFVFAGYDVRVYASGLLEIDPAS